MKTKLTKEPKGKVSKEVKSYANEPFFVKKAAESKAFLTQHGFPEGYLKTKR